VAPFAIRRMAPDDLGTVMRIERAAHRWPWSEELLRRELDHDWSTVLLAVDGEAGEPWGFLVYWLVHDEIHVLNVATLPDRRRLGVARALLEESEARGRERGARLTTLEVRRSNEGAIALYESLGYRRVGMRPRYYSENGEDAFVMTKEFAD
jgi:[ribosomal protein S18]-alanine N-acetyltransferase